MDDINGVRESREKGVLFFGKMLCLVLSEAYVKGRGFDVGREV